MLAMLRRGQHGVIPRSRESAEAVLIQESQRRVYSVTEGGRWLFLMGEGAEEVGYGCNKNDEHAINVTNRSLYYRPSRRKEVRIARFDVGIVCMTIKVTASLNRGVLAHS